MWWSNLRWWPHVLRLNIPLSFLYYSFWGVSHQLNIWIVLYPISIMQTFSASSLCCVWVAPECRSVGRALGRDSWKPSWIRMKLLALPRFSLFHLLCWTVRLDALNVPFCIIILSYERKWKWKLLSHVWHFATILAWKIPRMEETGRWQSMGLQRVGHDWATPFPYFIGSPIRLFIISPI